MSMPPEAVPQASSPTPVTSRLINFQRIVIHILQSLTIASIIGATHVLTGLWTEAHAVRDDISTLNQQVASMKAQLDAENIPEIKQNVAVLQADDRWIQQSLASHHNSMPRP